MPRFRVVIGQQSFVWARELSGQAIAKRATEKKAETIARTVFLFIAGLCFVGFVLFGYIFGFSLFTPNVAFLLLIIAIFFSIVSVSHIMQTTAVKHSIPKQTLVGFVPQPEPFVSGSKSVDIATLFDPTASQAIDSASSLAEKFGHATVEPLHLFVSALSDENAGAVLGRLQIDFEKIKDPLGRRLASRQIGTENSLSIQSEQTLLQAFLNAYGNGRQVVNTFEIFFEAYRHDPFIKELFFDQGVSEQQFANMVAWVRIHEKMKERYEAFRKAAQRKPTGAMNRAMTSVATPSLDAFSEDLTTAAVQGRIGLLVGRDREVEEIFRVIEGGRQSVVLVGPTGVGKQTLIEGIAALMTEERVPEILQDKRLVRISIVQLLYGVDSQQAQQRLSRVLFESLRAGNIVLAVSDLDSVTDNLAAILVEFLSRGNTFMIATTTPQGFADSVERSVLARVFEKVSVQEPEQNAAIQILESKVLAIEAHRHVSFSYAALEAIVTLSDRFMHESYLPKKGIELASEVALMVIKERGAQAFVSADDVGRLISEKTGVPTTRAQGDEKETLLHLEERIHDRMVGQEEAVRAVASALRRARTQLQSENRPIATFLFLGPTGVGKTELAKTVAQMYFGSEENMVRLDMSEYQQQDSIARLIGSQGSNQGGHLTEAIRSQPFSLVLLDEFEKAHPDLLNIFLQVFDDGRLTDATGRTIDFTNTILIATSNAGSQYIQEAVRASTPVEQMKTQLIEQELKGVYRPELLNRFDGVIVFAPLTKEEIVEITRRMVEGVAKRLEAKGVHFRADDSVIAALAEKGYDPVFGARPLRRLVQDEVDNAIADALLKEEISRRDTIVLEPGGIRIEKAQAL